MNRGSWRGYKLKPKGGESSQAYADRLASHIRGIQWLKKQELLEKLKELFSILVDPDKSGEEDDWRYHEAPTAASVTLQAVGEVAQHMHSFPPLASLVSSNAGLLMTWIRYFYRMKLQDTDNAYALDMDGKQKLIQDLSSAILVICYSKPVNKDHHPQIIPSYDMVCKLWLEEDIESQTISKPGASRLLSNLLEHTPEGPYLAVVEAMYLAANQDADHVSDIAISRLRFAMKKLEDGRGRIPILPHLINAIMLSYGRNNPISHSMHRHQIFTTFSKCIRLLVRPTSRTTSSERAEFRIACAHYYRLLFDMVLTDAENGTRALKQCIQYGMLDGIAQLLTEIQRGETVTNTITASLENAFRLLDIGLMNEYVCVDIPKAFKRLPSRVFSTEISSSVEWKLWKHFVDETMIQCIFIRIRGLEKIDEKRETFCFYCKQRFPKRNLRKCAGCKIAKYCSNKCQADDWKMDHKATCPVVLEQWRERYTGAKESATKFANTVAFHDIRRHWTHLQSILAQKYPNVHPELVGFEVEYTAGLPTFAAFSIPDAAQEHKLLRTHLKTLERNIASEGSQHTLTLNVIYPDIIGKVKARNFVFKTYKENDDTVSPRLRPGAQVAEKRPSGRFTDGDIQLEACYDEIDEVLHRMKVKASMFPALGQDPLALVDQVCNDLDKDWPFKTLFFLRRVTSENL